jgi:hypothetical protein
METSRRVPGQPGKLSASMDQLTRQAVRGSSAKESSSFRPSLALEMLSVTLIIRAGMPKSTYAPSRGRARFIIGPGVQDSLLRVRQSGKDLVTLVCTCLGQDAEARGLLQI